ncbi:MAG: tRNA pseudouridine(55) synthase TruB [Lachnospiraceae bacterium]|nr:tRNA pseudouridine(55) synthase TruB [Lachnospiraceae bacterium]
MSGKSNNDTYTGVLPVFKERGWTSNDVVAKLRGILRMKRIGHTGTLDPEVTGVLPVCLGRATRIAGFLTDTDKTYRCVMRLGLMTDTEDMTGKVTKTSDASYLTEADIKDAVMSFVGEYDQIPPMYSAKKINGRKLYELAREGIEIERKPSHVCIRSISDFEIPSDEGERRAFFTVECSKGTYIRSLCRDIGEKLGCGACMESLSRIIACGLSEEQCITLAKAEEIVHSGGDIGDFILPIDHFYADCEKMEVSGVLDKYVRNGNKFAAKDALDGRYRIYLEDGTFAALYDIKDGEARPCRMFLS